MTPRPNTDAHVAALAARFPALLHDVQRHLREVGQPVRPETGPVTLVEFDNGRHAYMLNAPHAAHVQARLAALPAHRRLVQLFHSPAQFLQAIADPQFPDLVADPRWQPWLLLPLRAALHVRQFLANTPPRDWPWRLAQAPASAGAATEAAQRCGAELLGLLEALRDELFQLLEKRYADRPRPAVVLIGGARRLRVLAIAGRGSCYMRYCARDIADGLRAHGVDARYFLYSSTPAHGYEILRRIEAFDPDVVFLNGHSRESLTPLPRGLTVLSWDQDYCLVTSPAYAAARQPQDHLLLMLKDWEFEAARAGLRADHCTHLNPGTNLRIYFPAAAPPEPDCDVLFVGNYFPFEVHRKLVGFDSFDETSQRILLYARERLREWVLTAGPQEPYIIPEWDEFLPRVLADLGLASDMDPLHWHTVKTFVRYRIAHELLRELYVSALREFDLRVYGRNWEQVPAVAPFARPPIDNGPPLRAAIQRARINLNLHVWSAHHPRLYDTAAAGGFQLAARLPEIYPLEAAFDPRAEIDTFGSIAELKDKIRFYLGNPDRRTALARRAAERAAREHSYAQRMGQVVEVLRRHDNHHPDARAAADAPVAAAISG